MNFHKYILQGPHSFSFMFPLSLHSQFSTWHFICGSAFTEHRVTLMRQSSSGEDVWSILVQQRMGLTCLLIKRPWCVPFCLTEGEKAAHAYIMGGKLFWDDYFFSFWLRSICLLVGNRCKSLTMALHHPSTLLSLVQQVQSFGLS